MNLKSTRNQVKMKLIFTVFAAAFVGLLHAQPAYLEPTINWQKSYGGTGIDKAREAHPTADGGFIVIGTSGSNDGDVSANYGQKDIWIIKTDSVGTIEWQKNYGGSEEDVAQSIQQTFDGGYIVGATTFSNDSDVSGNHGLSDFWIFKLDSVGNILWSKVYGGSQLDNIYALTQIADSGYLVAGSTDSNDGDVFGNHGLSDYWVLRLNKVGDTLWTKCYGGTGIDVCRDAEQINGGNFILAGYSNSNNGDLTNNIGGYDYWVVKIDRKNDTIIWQYSYGGTYDDMAYSITQCPDLGYLLVGSSYSNDVNVSGHSSTVGPTGNSDVWTLKLLYTGAIHWETSRGGFDDEIGYDAVADNDGGYTVAGYSKSKLAQTSPNHGLTDYWLIHVDWKGRRQWSQVYGGSQFDAAYSIDTLPGDAYIVAGYANSNDSDVTNNHGSSDYWVLKLNPFVLISGINENQAYNNDMVKVAPNPFVDNTSIVIQSEKLLGKKCVLNIYNAQGERVKSYDAGDRSIIKLSKSAFSAGLYSYNLIADGSVVSTGKFIAQ